MRGLDALHSGLVTFPQAIGLVLVVRIAGRLYPRIGPRRMMLFGAVSNVAITGSFVFVGLGTSLWWIRGLLLLRGMATAPAMVAMQVATYATVPPHKTGRASSVSNTDRQVASALCVAVLATVLASRTRSLGGAVTGSAALVDAQVSAFHEAMLVSAGITVLAVLAAWFIHDVDAAATMSGARPAEAPAAH
jgi:MFS family permease